MVFAGVPLTSGVAALNGEPLTRSGGRVGVAVTPKPSAANAAEFELVTVRVAALSVCSALTPPLMVDGEEVPVLASIFVNSVWTLSGTLSWLLPVAPEAPEVTAGPLRGMAPPAAHFAARGPVAAPPATK